MSYKVSSFLLFSVVFDSFQYLPQAPKPPMEASPLEQLGDGAIASNEYSWRCHWPAHSHTTATPTTNRNHRSRHRAYSYRHLKRQNNTSQLIQYSLNIQSRVTTRKRNKTYHLYRLFASRSLPDVYNRVIFLERFIVAKIKVSSNAEPATYAVVQGNFYMRNKSSS